MNLNLSSPQLVDCSDVEIPMRDVLRRIGYPPGYQEKNDLIQSMLDEETAFVQKNSLGKGIIRILEIQSRSRRVLFLKDIDFSIQSSQVVHLLRNSEKAVLFMATLGETIENRIQQLLGIKDITRSMILDAIASETADAVADHLHRNIIKQTASKAGYKITARFSPGYGDWLIGVQAELLQICGGERIGISLNDSYLMHPRKSVSAVFGLEKEPIKNFSD